MPKATLRNQGRGKGKPFLSTFSIPLAMSGVPDVDIDPSGVFKYVLVKVRCCRVRRPSR